jgi:hypothetical protein
MSMIGMGVLAGIGACVGLGASAPVAAHRAYRKARARAAHIEATLMVAYQQALVIEPIVQKPMLTRVDFRMLDPRHISRVPDRELEVADCDFKTGAALRGNDGLAPARIIEVPVEVERIVYKTLPDDLASYVTVLDVLSEMGVEAKKEITWPVGRAARRAHIQHYGVPPRMVTRGSTRSGGGTHAYAGYPPEFVHVIKGLLRQREVASWGA